MSSLEKLILERRKKERNRKKRLTYEQLRQKTKDWCTFYRRNWNIYATDELGVKLHFFQQVAIFFAGISDVFYFMCGRGLSKSFLAALIAIIQCMLYPRSEVVITATTIKTAKKMVDEKIKGELFGVFSPKLRWLYNNGHIKITDNQEEIRIDFTFNKSWIKVLPEQDSSRGERATLLIFEEARLLKKHMVDSVFIPMRHARVPEYRANIEKYKNDPELVERAKIVYLTSTRYKHEWFWKQWVVCVNNFFGNARLNYFIFAGDIISSIAHGFTTEEDFEIAKLGSSEMEVRMEYYNEPIGEVEGAFYSLEMFKRNSIIEQAFVPPTTEEYILKHLRGEIPWFRDKKDGEQRVVYVDFAFTDTTSSKRASDNTVIGLMSGFPNDARNHILRNTEYMETFSGGQKDESTLRIRELFYLYNADILIVDIRNGGEDRIIDLTKPYYHDGFGIQMNGFGIFKDATITDHYCSAAKVDNLSKRVVDPNAVPVIIPVVGQDDRNNNFHIAMKNALESNLIRFPMDEIELKEKLSLEGIWGVMTPNERMRRSLAHVQIDIMVEEAIKLEQKIKRGFIALETVGDNKRDRIVATEYANYYFYLQELSMIKKAITPEFDINDWQLWG